VALGIFAAAYSFKYMVEEDGLEKYYALMLFLVAGLMGVALAGDLFTLFVFWELMCIASYALVSFKNYRWEPVEAGFKYLVISTIGSLAALYGMSFLYGITGTLNIAALISLMPAAATNEGYFALVLIFAGFGVTSAMVPFHTWLPDAHPAAPSPVSALLSGVVIKAGIYAIFRIMFTVFTPASYDFGILLIIFGALTLTIGNLMVLPQRDIKRFLAFSSIANVGLILLAGGIAAYVLHSYAPPVSATVAALALSGAAFHILNHAVGKGLLFLASGCLIHSTGSRDISELEGIARRMPWSGGAMSVGLLNLGGVPPLGGFWSKLLIIMAPAALLQDPLMAVCVAVILLNSLLAAGYYIWLTQRLAFKEAPANPVREAPAQMLLPVVLLALACVAITLLLPSVIGFVSSAVLPLLG
jgi:proton-translocating NADH-quinone oxidoreductase chain N